MIIKVLTWSYFHIYLHFGFSSIYSICLWFVEFSFEINRTSVHMGRVFYILRMFLATLVTNLFLLLLRQKSIKEPKLIYLTQDKRSRLLTCLFYQKIYSALSFCVGTCFSQIIHVLCWTVPLPGIQPVVWSLSWSMSFSVVCFPSFLSLIQCVCLLSAPHLLLIECSQLGSHGCRRLVRKRL